MWIWPILVVMDVAVMVAAAVLWTRGRPSPPPETTGRASQISEERYARGEINEDEYSAHASPIAPQLPLLPDERASSGGGDHTDGYPVVPAGVDAVLLGMGNAMT